MDHPRRAAHRAEAPIFCRSVMETEIPVPSTVRAEVHGGSGAVVGGLSRFTLAAAPLYPKNRKVVSHG